MLRNPGAGMKLLKLYILVIGHVKPTNSLKINAHQWSRSWMRATAKASPGVVLQKSAVGRDGGSVQGLLSLPQEQLSVVPNLRLRSWAAYKTIRVEISWPFHVPFPTPSFYGPFCPLPSEDIYMWGFYIYIYYFIYIYIITPLLLPFHRLWLLPDSKAEVFSLLSRSSWGSSHAFLTALQYSPYPWYIWDFSHIGGSFQSTLVPLHLPDLWSPKASSDLCNNSTVCLLTVLTYLSLFLECPF